MRWLPRTPGAHGRSADPGRVQGEAARRQGPGRVLRGRPGWIQTKEHYLESNYNYYYHFNYYHHYYDITSIIIIIIIISIIIMIIVTIIIIIITNLLLSQIN